MRPIAQSSPVLMESQLDTNKMEPTRLFQSSKLFRKAFRISQEIMKTGKSEFLMTLKMEDIIHGCSCFREMSREVSNDDYMSRSFRIL